MSSLDRALLPRRADAPRWSSHPPESCSQRESAAAYWRIRLLRAGTDSRNRSAWSAMGIGKVVASAEALCGELDMAPEVKVPFETGASLTPRAHI